MSKGAFRARISSFPKICRAPPGRYHTRRLFHRRVEIRKRGGEWGLTDNFRNGEIERNNARASTVSLCSLRILSRIRVQFCPAVSLASPELPYSSPRLISRYTGGCRGESLGRVTRSETGPTGTRYDCVYDGEERAHFTAACYDAGRSFLT